MPHPVTHARGGDTEQSPVPSHTPGVGIQSDAPSPSHSRGGDTERSPVPVTRSRGGVRKHLQWGREGEKEGPENGFSRPKSETRTVFADAGSNASLSLPLFPGTSRFTAEWVWNRAGEEPGADDLMDEGRSARFRSHLVRSQDSSSPSLSSGTPTGECTPAASVFRDRWAERSVRLEVAWVSPSREGPISLGETLRLEVRSTFPDRIESYRWLGPNASQAIDQETRGNLTIASVGLSDAGQWVCELLRDGELEGSISYILEVRVLERQEGDKVKPTAWGTLFTIMGSLVILVVILLVVLCTWIKSRRRNFPALEITLPTLSSSKKQ
ncbi:uncharacterized protein [Narcine bancroftii]|uniref:uncharacterized protein n=1 Tax=Narcine bancroftii TaxID=1343680 RepID=UPI003831EC4F